MSQHLPTPPTSTLATQGTAHRDFNLMKFAGKYTNIRLVILPLHF